GSLVYFEDRTEGVPLPKDWDGESRLRERDLTWDELWERRQKHLGTIQQLQGEVDQVAARLATEGPPADLAQHLKNLQQLQTAERFHVLFIEIELLMRPALALGCFFFIVIACPVGIWFGRSDYLSSFITCFMPIVFLYYPLLLCGTGVAKEGRLPHFVMVWAADALIATVGACLLWRLVRK